MCVSCVLGVFQETNAFRESLWAHVGQISIRIHHLRPPRLQGWISGSRSPLRIVPKSYQISIRIHHLRPWRLQGWISGSGRPLRNLPKSYQISIRIHHLLGWGAPEAWRQWHSSKQGSQRELPGKYMQRNLASLGPEPLGGSALICQNYTYTNTKSRKCERTRGAA